MPRRDPGIEMGRNRLFDYLGEIKWIFKAKGKRAHWEAYQPKIDAGLLSHKLGGRFINEQTGQWEQADPTVRITAKRLHELHKRLGGTGPVLLVA
ncbi:Phage antirepressor protein KilAC domain protein [Corynebacterium faecale]|uniref:phage antirepressor KilAC domain-containing protein n=1 Tax=Corynebacterium faecale TaxID=1758466 RepID=UPI0025B601B8|nr:phage antirepressor KilAC domain-containing protein [Corynebacterium faecale]WJY92049.1 Phage antirepressor protein KilAC domain protein [Corynebacterium faecale]